MKQIIVQLIIFVTILCAAALTAGCGSPAPDASAPPENTQTAEPTETPEPVYEIESPIGTLVYPEKWQSIVRTEQQGNDLLFYAAIGDHPEVLLYTLRFGPDEEGVLLTTVDGTDVSIIEGGVEFDEMWSDEEQQQYYAMQADVNTTLHALLEQS